MSTGLYIKLSIWTTIFLILIGCQKNVHENPIASDIFVELIEEGGSIHLLAETEKVYGYLGYPINYSERRLGSKIYVKYKYIEDINGGATALGPATCRINLGKLENEKYSIKFKLNGETTEGRIIRDPLKLELSEPGNVKMKNNSPQQGL